MVEAFADACSVNVGHEVADLEDPGNRRRLYLAVGDPKASSASWLDDGYPNFSRDMRTEVQPLGEIRHLDPRGYYLVFEPPEVAGELLAGFKRLGFDGQGVLVVSFDHRILGGGTALRFLNTVKKRLESYTPESGIS